MQRIVWVWEKFIRVCWFSQFTLTCFYTIVTSENQFIYIESNKKPCNHQGIEGRRKLKVQINLSNIQHTNKAKTNILHDDSLHPVRKKISFCMSGVKSEPSKTFQLNTSSLMDVFIFLRLSQRAAPASSTLSFSIVFQLKLSTDDFFRLSMLLSPAIRMHTKFFGKSFANTKKPVNVQLKLKFPELSWSAHNITTPNAHTNSSFPAWL